MYQAKVHQLTEWEELQLWWAEQGSLYHALAQYYLLCCAVGFITGFEMGRRLAGW